MRKEDKTYYKTKDLGEASALLVKGVNLVELEKSGRIFWFVFENTKLCEKFGKQYWFGELMVGARDINEKMKGLKARIFNNP